MRYIDKVSASAVLRRKFCACVSAGYELRLWTCACDEDVLLPGPVRCVTNRDVLEPGGCERSLEFIPRTEPQR